MKQPANKRSERIEEVFHQSNFAFWTICLIHDNPLLPVFRNPYKLLATAGLKSGQKVLEVGCGPGFFTIPASKIVGSEGLVYAVDTHPLAIKRVKKKIEKEGIRNVKPILANASDTGLPEQSVDLAFLFGVPRIVGGLENVLSELRRVLRTGAVLSFEKARGSQERLIEEVERKGFSLLEKQGRIFLLTKSRDDENA